MSVKAIPVEYEELYDNEGGEFVYFVVAGDAVKIGLTADLARRLSNLQTAHSQALELVALMRGSREVEAELHGRFAAHHLRGAWFVYANEIRAYVASVGIEGWV